MEGVEGVTVGISDWVRLDEEEVDATLEAGLEPIMAVEYDRITCSDSRGTYSSNLR